MPHSFSARARLRAGAVVAAIGVISSLGVASTAHAATSKVNNYEVNVHKFAVTTSTDKKLELSIGVVQDGDEFTCSTCGDDEPTDTTVSLATPDGHEQHDWDGFGPAADYTLPDGSTPGTANSGTELAPLGAVTLTVTPTGEPRNINCGSTVGITTQSATVSGSISFDTRSTGKNAWGVVGTDAGPLAFTGTAEVATVYENDCFDQLVGADCRFGTQWSVGGANRDMFGLTGSKNPGFEFAHFAQTGNMSRSDFFSGRLHSAKLSLKGKHVTVHLKARGGFATGSGTISAKLHETDKGRCGAKLSKAKFQLYKGSFKNGSKPFTIHPQIFKTQTMKSGSTAYVERALRR